MRVCNPNCPTVGINCGDTAQLTDFDLRRSGLRVASEVNANALWEQAFATALAPARKSGAAALCSHTRAKTVLLFTRSLRWLISAFHKP